MRTTQNQTDEYKKGFEDGKAMSMFEDRSRNQDQPLVRKSKELNTLKESDTDIEDYDPKV